MKFEAGVNSRQGTAYTYVLEPMNSKGCLIAMVDGFRVLLDTGSPYTFRFPDGPEELQFLGAQLHLRTLPLPGAYLRDGMERLGIQIDALIGMDLLGRYAWAVDPDGRSIHAMDEVGSVDGITWIPMAAEYGPPIIHLDDGKRVILDTGASLSYRVGAGREVSEPVANTEDWSLIWGTIRTPVWSSILEVGGVQFPVEYGHLPEEADRRLAWMETCWVIGSDLLRAFRVILDFPNGRLGLQQPTTR